MKVYKLSFGSVTIFSPNLAEVIINEGVIMDELNIDEYHDFLLTNLDAPFSLLVNKKHAYTYTFEAQKIIGKLKGIKTTAVVTSTPGALMSTEMLMHINSAVRDSVKIFNSREEALAYLKKE
ncbi:hypothetical protein [Algibacter sp. L3A6]|uniref:hypothetical protein n=1 Tax=Algibacter sp. L3A6 TaxID=2686366 RepID=UPI00131AA6E3|nr:hypothetical protein [Algibacter sp. L3A6]